MGSSEDVTIEDMHRGRTQSPTPALLALKLGKEAASQSWNGQRHRFSSGTGPLELPEGLQLYPYLSVIPVKPMWDL